MKMAFWGVFAAGFVACSALGIGPVLKHMGGNWMSAPILAGMVLGVAIVALAVAFAMGYRPTVLPNDQAMDNFINVKSLDFRKCFSLLPMLKTDFLSNELI